MFSGGDIHRNGVQQGVCHLAGDEPLPDQLVKFVLVRGEIGLHLGGGQFDHGGPDGLVGVLGVFLGLEGPGLGQGVAVPEGLADKLGGVSQRLPGDAQRIGTHVGDETHRPQAVDVDALV